MPYKLSVMFEGKVIERHEFDKDRVVIGRAKECELVIDNLGISRQHAEIIKEGGVHVLRDLKSNNGTFVNGRRVRVHNLNDGEEIGIGKFTITFSCPEQLKAAADAPEGGGEMVGGQTMAIEKSDMDRQQRERMSAVKGHLIVGKDTERRVLFLEQPVFTIGSDRRCDFKVSGGFVFRRVARKHAIIFRDTSGFRLIDTSQRGATYINGNSINDERLKDGDVIHVGGVQMTYHVGTPVQP